MSDFVAAALSAGTLAGVYALAALGFVIVYRATKVFNFAQGEFMLIGAYVFYATIISLKIPLLLSLMTALLVGAAIGLIVYVAVVRSMTGQPLFAVIIVTMGVSIFMRGLAGVIWGPVARFIPLEANQQTIRLGGAAISYYDVVAICVAAACCLGFLAFFRFSRTGLEMRATAESPLLAGQRGVNVTKVLALTWALAGLAAAIGGVIYAGRSSVSPSIDTLGLHAFPVALVGGFSSVGGTLVGAIIVATAETIAALTWGPTTRDVVAFSILLIILMVRPSGLFGSAEVERL